MKFKFSILLLTTLLINYNSALSSGALDSSFNSTGIFTYDFGNNDNINNVTLQPDQKIILTGVALTASFTGTLKVMRLNTDGTIDTTFGTNGIFSLPTGSETYGYESHVRSDGKIIVAGIDYNANIIGDMLLLRLNSNGTLDTTFGTNGSTIVDFYGSDDYAYALTVQTDGKIIVAGTATDTINYYNVPTIIRFTENGVVDSTFGTNGFVQIPTVYIDNELTSVIVQPNGKIIASGHFENTFTGSSDFDILVMRVDSNGILDTTFGNGGVVKTSVNGGIDDSFGLEMDNAGNIFVAGFTTLPFTLVLNMVLLKYDSTGILDPSFGNSGIALYSDPLDNYANDLKIQSDNKILVCGSIGSVGAGSKDFLLWRYLPNGTIDSTFGQNGIVTTNVLGTIQDCNSIVIQQDGKIVGGGKAQNSMNGDFAVVRYLNEGTLSINETNRFDSNVFPNPAFAGSILKIKIPEMGINTKVLLYDISGQSIFVENVKLSPEGNLLSIQIPEYVETGSYFLKVISGEKEFKTKLIIEGL